MRKLLYSVARNCSYNMTSSYGKKDNCAVPDSCTTGTKLYITYGHMIDVDRVLASPSDMLVTMFREPMSWLYSRWKHAYKFNNQKIGLYEAAQEYGVKYFNFADSKTRSKLALMFEKKVSGSEFTMEDDVISATEGARTLFKRKCLVLLYDRFNASVQLVSYVLSNEAFQNEFFYKFRYMTINKGPQDRRVDKMVADVSAEESDAVRKLLYLHFKLYEEAVTEFNWQLQNRI